MLHYSVVMQQLCVKLLQNFIYSVMKTVNLYSGPICGKCIE